MANIVTRSSVLAVIKEVTENTPVVPTAGTQVVALQGDFTIEAAFDSLANEELRSSIGRAAPIQGAENPTLSGSHYLRHSGTEGVAPNYSEIVESFFGEVVTESTEYDTVSSSTTSYLLVNTGEGAQFQKGQGLLIKDGTNGYRIRAIQEVSGDALILGFQVPVAPSSAVNLGKCTLFNPKDTGHPTLTSWYYLGNGGALQMMSGGRTTALSIEVSAGELINMNYTIEGLQFYFNPIKILSTNKYIDFEDDDGVDVATIAEGMYTDPHELADAIETAFGASGSSEVYTVTYNDTTGKFKIVGTGTLLTLKWATGANTANTAATVLGYTVADDSGTAATVGYTADNVIDIDFGFTPSYDTADPNAAKYNEVMLGDSDDYACFEASTVSISGTNARTVIASICAESGRSGSVITGREIEISVTARLQQYDVDMWRRFRENDDVRFQFSYGPKSGGAWVAGSCGYAYAPQCKISSFNIEDQDGLAIVNLTLQPYVGTDGTGEFFLGNV